MASLPNSEPEANELRTDFLGRSVVLTPRRASRPHDFAPVVPQKSGLPAQCFFCPGNESKTPPEIERVAADGSFKPAVSLNSPDVSKWLTRVFPNKFPAFGKNSKSAYGAHEVIVETSDHTKTLSQLDEAAFVRYLGMMARRLRAHAKDRKIKYTCVFKNEWADAGASLEHTHTQMVAMNVVPDNIKKQKRLCASSCPFCLLAVDDKFSKIIDTGPFLVVAPYAPRFNHEVWIVPRMHTANIVDLDEEAIKALARTLRTVLRAQDSYLNYPAYNILFFLAPHREKAFHFHIEICPRMAKWAGFEYGAETVMNSIKPEWTAAEYKEEISKLK